MLKYAVLTTSTNMTSWSHSLVRDTDACSTANRMHAYTSAETPRKSSGVSMTRHTRWITSTSTLVPEKCRASLNTRRILMAARSDAAVLSQLASSMPLQGHHRNRNGSTAAMSIHTSGSVQKTWCVASACRESSCLREVRRLLRHSSPCCRWLRRKPTYRNRSSSAKTHVNPSSRNTHNSPPVAARNSGTVSSAYAAMEAAMSMVSMQ
mmetsp:Transcript_4751/g.17234  ORF Transcript_4751/g.17234 Transcript_4751/m.17234 type:complete len:208 (+) Transcript_4751:1835-2458(+)